MGTLHLQSIKCIHVSLGIDSTLVDVVRGLGLAGGAAVEFFESIAGTAFGPSTFGKTVEGAQAGLRLANEALQFIRSSVSGDDQLYVKFNDVKVWPLDGRYNRFQAGQERQVDASFDFTASGLLQLVEWDSGGDDSMGLLRVSGANERPGSRDLTTVLASKREDSCYVLSYSVTYTPADTTGQRIALKACNDKFVCAEDAGRGTLVANRAHANEWETFELITGSNGRVALRACNDRYVRVQNRAGTGLIAARDFVGDSESFEIVDLGSSKIGLRATNGKFVCAEDNGRRPLVANRPQAGPWETFERVAV